MLESLCPVLLVSSDFMHLAYNVNRITWQFSRSPSDKSGLGRKPLYHLLPATNVPPSTKLRASSCTPSFVLNSPYVYKMWPRAPWMSVSNVHESLRAARQPAGNRMHMARTRCAKERPCLGPNRVLVSVPPGDVDCWTSSCATLGTFLGTLLVGIDSMFSGGL